jgi:hypothetical protein
VARSSDAIGEICARGFGVMTAYFDPCSRN